MDYEISLIPPGSWGVFLCFRFLRTVQCLLVYLFLAADNLGIIAQQRSEGITQATLFILIRYILQCEAATVSDSNVPPT